jgi:hypothetical protein
MGGRTSARCLRYASSVASTFLRSSRASCGAQHTTLLHSCDGGRLCSEPHSMEWTEQKTRRK